MPSITTKDLQERTDEILRDVCLNGAEYTVSRDDVPVATLAQVLPESSSEEHDLTDEEIDEWFEELDRLAAEIGKLWPAGVSSVEAVAGQRR